MRAVSSRSVDRATVTACILYFFETAEDALSNFFEHKDIQDNYNLTICNPVGPMAGPFRTLRGTWRFDNLYSEVPHPSKQTISKVKIRSRVTSPSSCSVVDEP